MESPGWPYMKFLIMQQTVSEQIQSLKIKKRNMKKLIISIYIYIYNFGKRFNNEDTRIIVLFQIVYMFSFIGLGISLLVLRLWRMMYNEAHDFKFI